LRGIYFINEKISLKGLPEKQSIELQKEALLAFMRNRKMKTVTLNPWQINKHYSIPHALYYDLKKENLHLDFLVFYSPEVIEEYVETYPARWLMLKSFFREVITIEKHPDRLLL
jgi:hypothetical protein